MSERKDRTDIFLDDAFFLEDGKELIEEINEHEEETFLRREVSRRQDAELEQIKDEQIKKDDHDLEKIFSLSLTEDQMLALKKHFNEKLGCSLSTGIRTVVI